MRVLLGSGGVFRGSSIGGELTVRSCVFYAGVASSTGNTVCFIVPAGYTLLWKNALVTNLGSARAHVLIFAYSSGVSPYVINQDLDVAASVSVNLGLVLSPSMQVYATASAPGMHVWLSGSLLVGVAPLPPVAGTLPGFPAPPDLVLGLGDVARAN